MANSHKASVDAYKPPRFECQECGQVVSGQDHHDYTDCVEYRWTAAVRSSDAQENLNRAERDIEALISRIRELERSSRG